MQLIGHHNCSSASGSMPVLALQVFSTRLEEQLEGLRGEQRQLAETVARLGDAVAQLASAERPGIPALSKTELPSARAPQRVAGATWLQEAVRSPGILAAAGAFIGAGAAGAIILRAQRS